MDSQAFGDPNDSRAPCLSQLRPLPSATQFPFWSGFVSSQPLQLSSPPHRHPHPLQHILAGPVANLVLSIQSPSPIPMWPKLRGLGGAGHACAPLPPPASPGRDTRRSCPPLGTAAFWNRVFSAGFAVSRSLAGSLSPAPFPLQPPQKYIVFSPNPVQLQHNKTHNKNLIHFSPAPPISRHLLAQD